MRDFLLPTDLERNCAPEYLRYRGWSLAGALVSGVIGFMTTAVYLDSMKIAFSSGEQAALAGVITGSIQKATQVGGWMLARQGDADPKKAFLVSSLISSTNAVVGLGLLAVMPKANFPLACATAVTGTLAGLVGSAAGVNIFNHMAPGSNKGEVGAKNGNQDMVASCFGMPIGLALSHAVRSVGLNPAVVAACTLGPLLGLCTIQAARSVRMEAVGPNQLQTMADAYLATGEVPQAESSGVLKTLAGLLQRETSQASSDIDFVSSLQEANPEKMIPLFAGRPYLVSPGQDGKTHIALQAGAPLEQALQAYALARLVEKGHRQNPALESVALVQLALRALPEHAPTQQELCDKGWHASTARLAMPTVQAHWSNKTPAGLPHLTPAEFAAQLG